MKKIAIMATIVSGLMAAAPAQAQENPLSGLQALNGVTPLIQTAMADPSLLPDLLTNVGGGVGITALGVLGDPASLPTLSPLDVSSLGDLAEGTIMLQNYPGGAALIPVLSLVGGLLGGIIGTGN